MTEAAQAVHATLAACAPVLTPSARAFAARVYTTPMAVYTARLRGLGFVHRHAVLDAGCGFGQWAFALATLNTQVIAIDTAPARIAVVQRLATATGIPNVTAAVASMAALPYAEGQFDAVFAYGSLYLTPWREALAELVRVLAPRGLLYVNANGLGYSLHLWTTQQHAAPDYDPQEWAARSLLNTVLYRRGQPFDPIGGLLIEQDDLLAALDRLGCEVVAHGAEGRSCQPDGCGFFQGAYGGQVGVYEVVACKR